MRELEYVLRRAERRLETMRLHVYEPVADMECEAWLYDAPVEYGRRATGQRVVLEPGRAWTRGSMRYAWVRLYAPGERVPEAPAVRINLSGNALVVDGAGAPVCALSAGPGLEDGVLALGEVQGRVEVWLRVEFEPGTPLCAEGARPLAQLCAAQGFMRKLYYDMELMAALVRAREGTARAWIVGRALQRALDVLTELSEERALAAIYALGPEVERTSGDYGFAVSAVGRVLPGRARADDPDGAVREFARMVASTLHTMDSCDGYVTGAGGAWRYGALQRAYPALHERLHERVSQGRWEIQGVLWADMAPECVGGEAIVRNILLGKRFYASRFALDINSLWLTEGQACCAQLPQLMRRGGMQYLMCAREALPGSQGHTSFWLRGQDGSRVLAHVPYEAEGDVLPGDVCNTERGCGELGLTEGAIMLYGSAGSAPGEAQMEHLERMADLRGLPPVRRERAVDFFDRLRRSRVGLPCLSISPDGAAIEVDARARNMCRRMERELRLTELKLTAMRLRHDEYPRAELNRLWQRALELESCSMARNDAWINGCEQVIAGLDELAERHYGARRDLNVIINPHAWTVDMWLPGTAEDAPDMGRRISLPPLSASSAVGARQVELPARVADERTLSNDRLRLRFDERGRLASVYDLRQDWEVLRGAGNQLSVYAVDELAPMCAMRRLGGFVQVSARGEVDGAVCRRIAEYEFGDARMKQVVQIRAGRARVEFEVSVRWGESGRVLRAEFPLNVSAGRLRCESQYGSAECAPGALPGACWVDLGQTGRGAAVMVDGGYGCGCEDNVLYAELMRTQGACAATLRYALYPHAGEMADVERSAREFDQPPRMAHGSTFGPLCWVDERRVMLDAIKVAEDTQDVVLRMYECAGASCRARLRTGFELESASACDLLERVTAPLAIEGEAVELEFAPYEIKTVLLTPRR